MKIKLKLSNNEFYLIVEHSGHIFKTRSEEEFNKVKTLGRIIFADKIKNSQYLYFQCNKRIFSKKISSIKPAEKQTKNCWYDVHELDLKGYSKISKVWIGKKGENYERL